MHSSQPPEIRIVYPDFETKRKTNLTEIKREDRILLDNSYYEVLLALRDLRAHDTEYAAWYFDFTEHRQKTLEVFQKSKSQTWTHFKSNYEAMKKGVRPQFNK